MTAGAARHAHEDEGGALFALLLVQLFFGAFAVLAKVAMIELPAPVLATLRVALAALLLVLIVKALDPGPRHGAVPEHWSGWREGATLVGLALCGVVINQILFISGISRTTATNAAVISTTIPIFTLALAGLLGRERVSPPQLAGIATAATGVAILVGVDRVDFSDRTFVGNVLLVLNCLSYSLFLVLGRPYLAARRAIPTTARLFAVGAPFIAVWAMPSLLRFRPAEVSLRTWLCVAAIVGLSTVGAYVLNSWALARVSSSTVALFIFLQPLVAGSLAWPILGERPGPRLLGAGALILAGVLVALRMRPKAPA